MDSREHSEQSGVQNSEVDYSPCCPSGIKTKFVFHLAQSF